MAAGCARDVQPTGNLPPSSAGLRTLAALPSLDPVAVAVEVQAAGWRDLVIADAGVRILVPPAWVAVTSTDLPDLGDFTGMPATSRPMELLEPDLSDLRGGNLVAFAVEQPAPTGPIHETVISLTPWDFWDGEQLGELVPILVADRVGPGGWYEQAPVSTGVGVAGRVHYWYSVADVSETYDYLDYVFMSPNGPPFTLSFLMSASRVDDQWPLVEQIAASIRPLD